MVDAKLYITNMDNERRLQLCDIADGLLSNTSGTTIAGQKITNLKIQNLGNISYLAGKCFSCQEVKHVFVFKDNHFHSTSNINKITQGT